jgi:hypothetical protein
MFPYLPMTRRLIRNPTTVVVTFMLCVYLNAVIYYIIPRVFRLRFAQSASL